MHNNKLIVILRRLGSRELSKFEDLVHSPFFNKNGKNISLFNILKQFAPDFEDQRLERKALFQLVYPDLPFNEQKLRYAMTDLTKLLEQFLLQQKLREQYETEQLLLLTAYKELQLDNYFHSTLKSTRKELDRHAYKDSYSHLTDFLIQNELFQQVSNSTNRSRDEILMSMLDSLDKFFISTKLKSYCEIYNSSLIRLLEDEPLLLPEIMNHLQQYPYEDTPAIWLYQLVLKMMAADDQSSFFKLKEALTLNGRHFRSDELKNLYIYAQNYCAQQINTGNKEYNRQLFDLYKELVDIKMFFENGYMEAREYRNYVYVGLRLEDPLVIKEFIQKHKDHLHPDVRKSAYNYNLAYCYFMMGELEKVQGILSRVEPKDPYAFLDTRILLLRTYYELEEIVPLFSLIDSLKMYLRRSKILSEGNRTAYRNLIKFVTRLVKVKLGAWNRLPKLKADIEATKYIADLFWLQKKLEEVEASQK